MNFIKSAFVGYFCVVFLVYWSIRTQRRRLLWLLAASCFFYMSWNPWFILLIFASTSVDYLVALQVERTPDPTRRRLLVLLSVAVNLSILAGFKYALFALRTTQTLCTALGIPVAMPTLDVILPLGISFYTFEAISYVVDVYRGKIAAIRSPLDYALYILFFPHLVAGPIVRSGDFVPQLGRHKRFSWLRLQAGIELFVLGLIKKAVIADHLAQAVVDPVFASPGTYGSAALWLATLGYALQIYGDFSGYSDMAIGLAHMLGFKLPANFNMPYFAGNIAEFWRRWHISLSSWLRDYLYVPLGGNRHGTWSTYRNLLLTMALGGLWHGANWTFILWGAYHGMLLALHRACPKPAWFQSLWFRPVAGLTTFLSVCIGWVFFRAQSLTDALTILRGLFAPTAGEVLTESSVHLALACAAVMLLGHLLGTFVRLRRLEQRLQVGVAGAALAAVVIMYFLLLPQDSKGFIYFQF